MKTSFSILLFGLSGVSLLAQARAPQPSVPPTPAQPPVLSANPVAPPPDPIRSSEAPMPKFMYDQRARATRPAFVRTEQAQTIIRRFRDAYQKLGSPRLLVYVNR